MLHQAHGVSAYALTSRMALAERGAICGPRRVLPTRRVVSLERFHDQRDRSENGK
jgi:hypothetical protein